MSNSSESIGSNESIPKWTLRWLRLAKHISQWSKDPGHKCGCVITDGAKELMSMGYNGLPEGMSDDEEKLLDREHKLKFTIHAEDNALRRIPRNLAGGTLFVYPFFPCEECATLILNSGRINKVVTTDYVPERWRESVARAEHLLANYGITIEKVPMDNA